MRFHEPLSMLVIFDSFIQSGSVPMHLRVRFTARPPAYGGAEKVWTSAYVDVRHKWLSKHSNSAVRASNYRTACFRREIARGNWVLEPPVVMNGVSVSA